MRKKPYAKETKRKMEGSQKNKEEREGICVTGVSKNPKGTKLRQTERECEKTYAHPRRNPSPEPLFRLLVRSPPGKGKESAGKL